MLFRSALQKAGVTSGDRYAGMFEAAASGAEKAQTLTDAANSEMMKSMLMMAQAKDSRAMGMTDKALAEKNAAENHAVEAAKFRQQANIAGAHTLAQKEQIASREKIAGAQIAAHKEIAKQRGQLTLKDLMGAEGKAQETARKRFQNYIGSVQEIGRAHV